jgi:hypothetical protein
VKPADLRKGQTVRVSDRFHPTPITLTLDRDAVPIEGSVMVCGGKPRGQRTAFAIRFLDPDEVVQAE